MPLKLYNTLTRREEVFEPLRPPGVNFYSCGPTVYDYAHIGNFRSFLAADLLRRYLDYSGFVTRHVMNITDVGHMVDDSVADGAGLDKMEAARRRLQDAKKSGALPDGVDLDPNDPNAIADFYAEAFLEDARTLGLKVAIEARDRPELMPRPTRYIEAMIELVERLIAADAAYVASDGVVYFSVQSYPDYGRLSGNTLDQLRSGAGGRVDEDTQAVKKHPADFMLWKPDPAHLMRWSSPWGEGYPGWHLECSVMAVELLGSETGGVIDLHSGGEDNLFPHHECERAQTCAAYHNEQFSRFWFHPRHMLVEGGKMSKSAGNFFTARDIFAKGYEPAALRLELIKTHYRSNANFTMQGLKDSQRLVRRWREFVERGEGSDTDASKSNLDSVRHAFGESMDSDLNIAGALGEINKWIGATPDPTRADAALLREFDAVLGVLELDAGAAGAGAAVDEARVEALIQERGDARKSKDFARADEIRDELASMGVEIKDSPTGTTWSRKLD